MIRQSNEAQVVADNLTISSPDKDIALHLSTGNGPMGIVGPTAYGPVTVVNVYPALKIGKLDARNSEGNLLKSTDEAYVSEVVTSEVEAEFVGNGPDIISTVLGYHPVIVLHNSVQLSTKNTFQGVSGGLSLLGYMPGRYLGKFDVASITFGSSPTEVEAKPYATVKEANAQFKKASFQQAKAILLSAHYK